MEDSKLQSIHDEFTKKRDTRGARGGLGRVKGSSSSNAFFRDTKNGDSLPDTELYRSFVRGPTIGESTAKSTVETVETAVGDLSVDEPPKRKRKKKAVEDIESKESKKGKKEKRASDGKPVSDEEEDEEEEASTEPEPVKKKKSKKEKKSANSNSNSKSVETDSKTVTTVETVKVTVKGGEEVMHSWDGEVLTVRFLNCQKHVWAAVQKIMKIYGIQRAAILSVSGPFSKAVVLQVVPPVNCPVEGSVTEWHRLQDGWIADIRGCIGVLDDPDDNWQVPRAWLPCTVVEGPIPCLNMSSVETSYVPYGFKSGMLAVNSLKSARKGPCLEVVLQLLKLHT
eukprot:Platyproteum_vivax@DN4479_c0_g1_i1.p1